ncbi:hypothetical protein F2P81_004949 [Scophthalmus maximus]|uniref:Uncharacterized protein n=1 Tax=Scophthalmus maximus TaxID=52904 RepID=A0A6A4TNN5_SCOMX|nr:hypothetical protein F2P81_004949 [Scophthalmus maximus]
MRTSVRANTDTRWECGEQTTRKVTGGKHVVVRLHRNSPSPLSVGVMAERLEFLFLLTGECKVDGVVSQALGITKQCVITSHVVVRLHRNSPSPLSVGVMAERLEFLFLLTGECKVDGVVSQALGITKQCVITSRLLFGVPSPSLSLARPTSLETDSLVPVALNQSYAKDNFQCEPKSRGEPFHDTDKAIVHNVKDARSRRLPISL